MDNVNLVAALWIGLALFASLISIRLGISVALIEIGLGVVGGNVLDLQTTPWIDFLAAFGAILLTFLAGAEIDPESMRRHLRPSFVIGGIRFAAPAIAAFLVAYFGLGWSLQAAEIAGLRCRGCLADRPGVRHPDPRRELHDAADVDRTDVRDDRRPVRADEWLHRPS